nr:hypothetical protein [Psychrobacter sp. PraFG1]UNK05784.1 hypothetical protein MN210_03000 [Psychrobacter sp. PraFG1]
MPFASQSVLNQGANQPLIHRHVAVSPSTNSELMQQLANGDIDKTRPYLLTASMQTAGRGQRTRTWQSPIGNIYLSLYHPYNRLCLAYYPWWSACTSPACQCCKTSIVSAAV